MTDLLTLALLTVTTALALACWTVGYHAGHGDAWVEVERQTVTTVGVGFDDESRRVVCRGLDEYREEE